MTGGSKGRVVGLGQPLAGDDGVGPAVLAALGQTVPGWSLHTVNDPALLVEWLDGQPLIAVDAVVGWPPGRVDWVAPEALSPEPDCSTHGLGLAQAVGLARALHGPQALAGLSILGIGIAPPPPLLHEGLSAPVAAAVPRAVALLRAHIGRPDRPCQRHGRDRPGLILVPRARALGTLRRRRRHA